MRLCEIEEWQVEASFKGSPKFANIDVDFIDENGNVDETQFSIENPFTEEGERELEDLFDQFCRENRFTTDTVVSVTITDFAEKMELLS